MTEYTVGDVGEVFAGAFGGFDAAFGGVGATSVPGGAESFECLHLTFREGRHDFLVTIQFVGDGASAKFDGAGNEVERFTRRSVVVARKGKEVCFKIGRVSTVEEGEGRG